MKRLLLLITFVSVFVLTDNVQAQKSKVVHPTKVTTAIYFDEIPSLKDLPPVDDQYYIDNWGKSVAEGAEHESEEAPNYSNWKDEGPDPVWQKENGWLQSPKALIQNFAGQSSPYLPSDCNGTVGPNHFMQTVNTTYAIWDKAGNQVVAPTAMNTLFSGVAGSGNNDGDPLILFDEQADKWVAIEFSLDAYLHGGTYDYMLFAVSQTNDPTGAWWRWSFIMNGLPDYEKVGIWHDGYYMGTNLGSTSSSGDDVYVFERSVMITGGANPQQVQFHNPNRPNNGFHCIMPLDADGAAPPSSSPGQFITINDDAWGGSDELWIYECNVDWTTPSNSTFSRTQQISVPAFDSQFNSWGTGDIAQSGTSQLVDAQPYVLMVRGQYKNFGTAQSIVCLHTVDVDGTNHAGERWYELEKTSQTDPTWSIRQSGTYAPDANSRWMGSIAINDNHEIAMGYSVSGSSMSPNIRYCGQSASGNASATGVMDIAESADLVSSPQSQGSSNRWGDYSLMTVDPTDGITFWYTDEYYNSGKKTRILSFTIGSSVLTAQFSGTPTSVDVGNSVTFTDASYGPNPITSWNWSFPGGTPSSYSGQNPPPITYNTVGTYNVTLTVGDGSSTDVETKTNYINVINCTVSSYPWSEGFENGGNIPDCWSNEYVTDTQDWAYQAGGHSGNPSGAHTGSYNAYLYNGSTTANVTKLVTPQLDMSGLSSATLTFWHTQALWSPDQDELRIYYKSSSGGSWTLLAEYTNNITSWTQETINLPGLSGDYYIAFEGTAKYGHGVCVDDVYVDGVAGGSPPVADFSADDVTPAVGQTVTFTDLSSDSPTSWSWSFSPATITYVGGTSSSSQNPQVTFDATGTYSVTLTATNAYGSDDEVKTNYITAGSSCPPVTSFPYTQDFDSWTTSSPAYQCTADGSVALQDCWTNVTGDDLDWDILSGATASGSTGPSSDHTSGSGNYLYTESSSCNSKTGYITSPVFDLSSFSSASLTFWYNMYGSTMGTMSVQISVDGGSTWSSDEWSLSGDQGSSWQLANVSLNSYLSANTVVRFTGFTGTSYTSDMAIDDITVNASSSGPVNDNCSGAIAINEVTDYPFNTSSATASGANLTCVYGSQVDLWYAYTATFTGDARFDLCGSGYDTGLGIWDACGGTQLACNDDDCGLQSGITMAVTSGTTYYVQVTGYSGATGSGDLTIRPVNDNCSGAIAINEVVDLPFNTSAATASGVQPSCGGSSTPPVDLWYAYTATITGNATFDLCGSSFDTRLTIWDACGGTQLACNDDDCGLQSSISMAVTSGTTYYVQVGGYNSNKGNGDLTIQVVVPGLWTGATSNDWGVGGNWDDSNVPLASTDVLIPSSPSGGNYPETNSGAGAECANLTIEAGAHLFIPSNNSLTVNGTLTNSAGTSGLIIESDATGTGSLIHNTAGVDATVERYLTDARWHFIGMPVSSAVAGVFHLPSGHSDIYLRTHIEASNTWDNWIVPVTTPLLLGRGYETWVGTPGGFSQPETIEFEGALNTGDYTTGTGGFYGLQYTTGHGLNMISNPYPSALEADIDTWSKSNIDNSVWIWSDSDGNYVYWNGTDGTNSNGWGTMTGGVIPEMQGFFVLANGANPSLTIPQSGRIHSNQAYYKDSYVPENTLRLEVTGNDYKDVAFVSFNESATGEYDNNLDVQKLFGLDEAPQLYSVIPNKLLSINSLPELTESKVVQLGFECGVNGQFTFTAGDIESFTAYTPIYLEDTKEGIIRKLNDNPVYTFNHSPLDDNNRFILHFGEVNGVGDISTGGIKVYSNKNTVYVQKPADFNGIVFIYDMLGQEIISRKANGEGLMTIPVTNGTGYYVVKVQSDNNLITQKVFIY